MSHSAETYIPGKPCQRCGTSRRYCNGQMCVECVAVRTRQNKLDAKQKPIRRDRWRECMIGVDYEKEITMRGAENDNRSNGH